VLLSRTRTRTRDPSSRATMRSTSAVPDFPAASIFERRSILRPVPPVTTSRAPSRSTGAAAARSGSAAIGCADRAGSTIQGSTMRPPDATRAYATAICSGEHDALPCPIPM